jgi:hypothetical protein
MTLTSKFFLGGSLARMVVLIFVCLLFRHPGMKMGNGKQSNVMGISIGK